MELATRQHGVVSTRQLAQLGYTRSSASKANGVGRLRRLHRGVYAVGHVRLTWYSHCMAVVLAVRPSVASHLSAGWLWGLLPHRPETMHVTAPTSRHPRRGFVVHSAPLARADITRLEGIPVTSLARAQLDLATVLSARSLDNSLKRAEEQQLFDLRQIEELLARSPHHPGAGPLRAALAIYRDEPAVTRSTLEERFLGLIREAGIPPPSMNYFVAGYEIDAYWEEQRFGVELDVFETHGTRQAFEDDRLREDDLLLAEIETIRVTGPRLDKEPDQIVARVTRHLRRRAKAR